MVIYEIRNNINDKIYIGKDTTNRNSYYGSGVLIKRAMEKYGKNNFTKRIIDRTDSYEELSKKEIYWIEEYKKTHILYNISNGGDGGDTLSKHPNIDEIKLKISNSSKTKGHTYEEVYGEERSKNYKNKLKSKLYLSLNSEKCIQNKKRYWNDYWKNYQKKCIDVKDKLKNCVIEDVSDDLILLFKSIRSENNIMNFTNSKGFYEFFDDERVDKLFKRKNKKNKICINCGREFVYGNNTEIYCSKKCVVRKNNPNYDCKHKKQIIIDNVKYDSITEASNKLTIDRGVIRYRLKSNNFGNYSFL
jgi:hypothetical protein